MILKEKHLGDEGKLESSRYLLMFCVTVRQAKVVLLHKVEVVTYFIKQDLAFGFLLLMTMQNRERELLLKMLAWNVVIYCETQFVRVQ